MYKEIDVLFNLAKPAVLQQEINALSKTFPKATPKSTPNPLLFFLNVSVVVQEIAEIKNMDELKKYLIEGDTLDKASVNQYIGDIIFESTHQYN